MFEELAEIRKARKKYNYRMFQSGISTFHDLEQLQANVFKSGGIEAKNKELIALGISISAACYG